MSIFVGSIKGPSPCKKGQLFCKSGECVDQSVRCDGKFDCVDRSDELGCAIAEEVKVDPEDGGRGESDFVVTLFY